MVLLRPIEALKHLNNLQQLFFVDYLLKKSEDVSSTKSKDMKVLYLLVVLLGRVTRAPLQNAGTENPLREDFYQDEPARKRQGFWSWLKIISGSQLIVEKIRDKER